MICPHCKSDKVQDNGREGDSIKCTCLECLTEFNLWKPLKEDEKCDLTQ